MGGPAARVRREPMIAARVVSLCVLLSAACCGKRASYPLGSTVEFDIACVRRLWPGPPAAPLELREAFCGCVVRRCQRRYDPEEFDRIRLALDRGDYRIDSTGVPSEFGSFMAECQAALDRGELSNK